MRILTTAALLLAACAGTPSPNGSGNAPDSGIPEQGPFETAAHVAFSPMPTHGGTTLRNLQLITVTFQGYPYRSFVESFGGFVGGSQWLTAVTQDYGPVTAVHRAAYVLPAPPNGASSDFTAVLQSNLDSGTIQLPADPTGVLFLVYAPLPCSGGGYHGWFDYSGKRLVYAVGLNCQDASSAEAVMTHEIAEAASDPFFDGYFFDDGQRPWAGEGSDICNFAPWTTEGGYRLLPAWSNKAAASGGSPCVPYAAGPYFNVSPSPAAAQTVDAGSSVTFTLTGWSTAPGSDWPLQVFPDNYAGQDFDPQPSFSRSRINNGQQVTLTLHVPAGTVSGKQATVRVKSGLDITVDGVGGFSNDWPLQIRAR